MSWRDRINGNLVLISPDGNVFEALWQKNNLSIAKKIGIFEYPKINKTITQDLGVIGVRSPLTFFFEGENHDLEMLRFKKSIPEVGKWTILHPVLGEVTWQPTDFTIIIDPIGNGNITQIDSNWIEPADDSVIISAPQLASIIDSSVATTNATAADQFAENIQRGSSDPLQIVDGISQLTFKEKLAVESTTQQVIIAFDEDLGPIYLGTTIEKDILQIKRSINATLEETVLNPIMLIGQLQSLIQLPALVITDAKGRFDAYINFMRKIFGLSPTEIDQSGKNVVTVQEGALNAALVALAQISTTSVSAGELDTQGLFINTRTEAFNFADLLSLILIEVTENLDDTQENFKNLPVDVQYFSQSESYPDIATIIVNAIRYLISSAFSLLTERRFTLKEDKAAIRVCIEEYQSLGDNDEIFDFFIQTNSLKKNEIRLIRQGREIVAYG